MIFKTYINGSSTTNIAIERARSVISAFYFVAGSNVYIKVLYSDNATDTLCVNNSFPIYLNRKLTEIGWIEIPRVHTPDTVVEVRPDVFSSTEIPVSGRQTTSFSHNPDESFSAPYVEIRRREDGSLVVEEPLCW